jgi:hypothetical protein
VACQRPLANGLQLEVYANWLKKIEREAGLIGPILARPGQAPLPFNVNMGMGTIAVVSGQGEFLK